MSYLGRDGPLSYTKPFSRAVSQIKTTASAHGPASVLASRDDKSRCRWLTRFRVATAAASVFAMTSSRRAPTACATSTRRTASWSRFPCLSDVWPVRPCRTARRRPAQDQRQRITTAPQQRSRRRSPAFLCVPQAADGSTSGASAVILAAFAPLLTPAGSGANVWRPNRLRNAQERTRQQRSPNDRRQYRLTSPRHRKTNPILNSQKRTGTQPRMTKNATALQHRIAHRLPSGPQYGVRGACALDADRGSRASDSEASRA